MLFVAKQFRSFPKSKFLSFLGIGLFCILSRVQAAVWVDLNVPSFYTGDVVFENDGSPSVNLPLGARYFYEHSLRNNPSYPGLTSSGLYSTLIGSDTIPFQLQPYEANNLRKLGGSGSLIFDLPDGYYDKIAIALNAGNVAVSSIAGLTVTFNYSDLSSSLITIEVPDWGLSPTTGFVDVLNAGRANVDGLGQPIYENTNHFSIFGTALNTDPSKVLTSITFGRSTSVGEIGFFAFAGSVVPEPSKACLTLLGLMALLLQRRMTALRSSV